MIDMLGGVIPITETVFSAWNLVLALVVLVAISLLAGLMRPADADVIQLERRAVETPEPPPAGPDPNRPVARLENSRWFTAVIGGCLLLYIALWFGEGGFQLNLNIVNWTFLALTLVLCRSARHFLQLVERAGPAVAPLVVAYPFYAGIIGIMTDSGMASMLSAWFAGIATPETLPMLGFLSAMVVNLFIPSGGAQWMVQGPIFLEAANELGVELPLVVMSIAYGDQLTNLLQPLPAIPLLAMAGLSLKHIMGYAFIFFLAGFLLLGCGLAAVSFF